jgi:gas vesicle protein
MTSNTKIILGLLAAAAAGAAVGVLMAPEKGSDLRRKIKDTVDEWADDLSELLAIGKEEMKERFAEAREGMEEVKDTVSDTYNRRRGNN